LPLAVKIVLRLSNISGSAYGLVFNMVYNESAKVDSKFSDVADIAPGKDNLRIKVRVIRMWKVLAFLNPSDYSSLEMVLVDEKVCRFWSFIWILCIY
jgi:hypothetical protein